METVYIQHPISTAVSAKMESCVLALGFFDGIHTGHREIIQTAKEIARKKQLTLGVMTFYPHPKDVICPDQAPMKYLTPLPIKEERFRELGVEKLFVVKFEPVFASLSPEDFVNFYIKGLQCKHVVAGFDYHYGFKGSGNMRTLKSESAGEFEVTAIQKIEHEEEKISSTIIRHLLAAGNVEDVPNFLGDFYEIRGEVKESLSYHTHFQFAKVFVDGTYRIPAPGIYKIEVEIEGQTYQGICHQITETGNVYAILIQISYCFNLIRDQPLKIKWLQYLLGKKEEVYGADHYFTKEKLVI
ncbi:adenylyltransferase/cytidyltransferase family protein [Bacillus sp. OHL2]|uniref:adenylyltransferase/cytidyltransferase family protein n=1 Tax=Bacillus safensis TaxID=561879 RepID=UPI000B43361E|nr:adenylyltransferase/cytidyltransferase family protein [Bacillus safensis]UDB46007.1 adenylyltransferase/cytidyltransferase family protein [Bacillus safensis]